MVLGFYGAFGKYSVVAGLTRCFTSYSFALCAFLGFIKHNNFLTKAPCHASLGEGAMAKKLAI